MIATDTAAPAPNTQHVSLTVFMMDNCMINLHCAAQIVDICTCANHVDAVQACISCTHAIGCERHKKELACEQRCYDTSTLIAVIACAAV